MNTANYLTVEAVASATNISKQTVTRRARLGRVEGAVLFRHCWYIPKERMTDGTFAEAKQGFPKGQKRPYTLANRRGRFSRPI